VVVGGIHTRLPLFRALVNEEDIINTNYHIHQLKQFLARGGVKEQRAAASPLTDQILLSFLNRSSIAFFSSPAASTYA
jgi:hypothetical protein